MWNRIRRIFRAMFGWLIRGAEDPELILRQLRDDLRDNIPELNRQVAEIVKHEKMLAIQLERQSQTVAKLRPQVEAAVKAGPERKEAAKALIMQLQQTETELAETQAALERAKQNSQQMLKMRTAYEQKTRQQMQECLRQIDRAKRADVEAEMASLMGTFEVGDEADTLQRMTERIDEQLARAQARMQVAETSVDSQILEIQQDAAVDASELAYQEYQRQLGLVPEEPETEQPAKTMAAIPIETEVEPPTPPETLEEEDRTTDPNWAQARQEGQEKQSTESTEST